MATSPSLTLEVVNGITVQVVMSGEPWTLDLHGLVVAVGPGGFGGLGRAMSRQLPAAFATPISFEGITPERPFWYQLAERSEVRGRLGLRSIVLATAHDSHGRDTVTASSPPTIEAAATGLVYALQLANEHGTARLGATLLGTGLIGFDVAEVAAATLPRIRRLIVDGRVGKLQRLQFIAEDLETRDAIARVWQSLASPGGLILAELNDVLDGPGPRTYLSGTAGIVIARAVARPGLAPRIPGASLVGEEILYEAFGYQAERQRQDVATALLRELAMVSPGLAVASSASGANPLSLVESIRGTRTHEPVDAVPLIEQAAAFAVRTIGQPYVRQRHLLAAAVLARPLIDSVHTALGVDDAGLRRCLRAAIREVLPAEAPSAWDEILEIAPEATAISPTSDVEPVPVQYSTTDLAGGYSTDLVNPEEAIPAADDLLGINAYVSMLANVVASSDTPLPLSIGLFGEWGSGKSFFMGRLRQQIAELSTQDGYLPRIEQIGFNAWHYADTNLWASLGDEIFRQLARPRAEEQDARARELEEERRKQLIEDLNKTLNRERELDAATANAQRQATELRVRLDAAREKQGEAVTTLLQSVAASERLQTGLKSAWNRLGVDDEVEQGALLMQQIRGVGQDINTFRRATAGRRGFILAAIVIASVLVLAAAAVASDAVHDWLVGSGLLGVAGGLATLTTFMVRVASGSRLLATVATEAKEEKDAIVTEQVRTQIRALDRAEADADILGRQLAEIRVRAGEIGRQLAELAPGQRFYGFVADRATSQDYQSKLGLISTIRRDFEKLITLMRDWRDHPADHGNHQPIDRIVLYIDDLDRCSPEQVVEVLQAVHLLLALDLFVVVVGVDPRWLLHSLEQRYRDNFATDPAGSTGRTPGAPDSGGWDATALNYLEKIFNIPFVLPAMSSASFADLISGWSAGPAGAPSRMPDTRPAAEQSGARQETVEAQRASVAARSGTPTDDESVGSPVASGVAAEVPVETDSTVDRIERGARPKPMPLSTAEVTHLRALAPLVQTPREAKRAFNLYRTLRASGNLSPASVFLGTEQIPGDFQAVIVLLGLLIAEPRLVGDLLWAPADATAGFAGGLCHREPAITWPALLDGLAPRRSRFRSGGWCNDLGKLGQQPGHWGQVLPRLRQASAPVTLPDLTSFQRWGPLVARFSFILSPLAVGERGGVVSASRVEPGADEPPDR